MATKKSSKRVHKSRPQHSAPVVSKIAQAVTLTPEGFSELRARIRDELIAEIAAASGLPRGKSERQIKREQISAHGYTLRECGYVQAEQALTDAAFGLRSIRQLAWQAEAEDGALREALLTGIQHAAAGIERHIDLVMQLLGAESVGVFDTLFTPKQQPSERVEAEGQHHA